MREDASLKELKRAYRRRALELHPDRHQNSLEAKEKFQALSESYHFLIEHFATRPSLQKPAPAKPMAPAAQAQLRPKTPPAALAPQAQSRMSWLPAAGVAAILIFLAAWPEPRKPEELVSTRVIAEQNGGAMERPVEPPAEKPEPPRAPRPPMPRPLIAAPPPAPRPQAQQAPSPPIVNPQDLSFRSTCYMTSNAPGDAAAFEVPNITQTACLEWCRNEVQAHRTDREIRCAFGGREIVVHIPDALEMYMSRNPDSP